MATTTKIWDGTTWRDLEGPQGPAGPTVVSADAGNVAKLGTDGRISVQPADMDSRWVNVAGDTMTGNLSLTAPAAATAPAGHIQLNGSGFQPAIAIQGRGDANGTGTPQLRLLRTRGTTAAPTNVQANDNLGTVAFYGLLPNGTAANACSLVAVCNATPAAGATGIKGEFRFVMLDGVSAMPVTPLTITSDGIIATNLNVQTITNGFVVNNGLSGIAITVNMTSAAANTANQAWGVRSYVDCVTKGSSCLVADNTGKGTDYNYGIALLTLARAPNNYSFYDASEADNYFKGYVGINWLTPTANLEVNGTAKIRGTIEITGNITSSGTAHNFAANSILSTAIKDLPIKTSVLTQAAYNALATKDPTTLYLISG